MQYDTDEGDRVRTVLRPMVPMPSPLSSPNLAEAQRLVASNPVQEWAKVRVRDRVQASSPPLSV